MTGVLRNESDVAGHRPALQRGDAQAASKTPRMGFFLCPDILRHRLRSFPRALARLSSNSREPDRLLFTRGRTRSVCRSLRADARSCSPVCGVPARNHYSFSLDEIIEEKPVEG